MALDDCGSYLITGSKDCTSILWSIKHSNISTLTTSATAKNPKNYTLNVSLEPKPVQTLYGHDKPISCVAIMTELDLAVSGSLDGTVNVYTIEEGQYVRTLYPLGCTGLKIEISFITISYQGNFFCIFQFFFIANILYQDKLRSLLRMISLIRFTSSV